MVLHDQSKDITQPINKLEEDLSYIGYPRHCTHAGPIIRNEEEYRKDSLQNRQKILKDMMAFIRHIDIHCKQCSAKVYYDNGQVEVSKILSSVFNSLLDIAV